MCEAIQGRPESLDLFKQLWRQWQSDAPPLQADAARAALLRYTLDLWRGAMADGTSRSAQYAVPALEIVAILTEPVKP